MPELFPGDPAYVEPMPEPPPAEPKHRVNRVSARTDRLAKSNRGMKQRREMFEQLGCQDMKGLYVTDRGLAAHMGRLADEVGVALPKNKFIPEPPHFSGARVKS